MSDKPVKPIEEMDAELLIKHFNARHCPIAGLEHVIPRPSDPDEELLRKWHRHTHRTGEIPAPHEHRAPR